MSKKLFIGNLNFDVTSDELRDYLGGYGSLLSLNIIEDRFSLKSKGFAHAVVENQKAAEAILEQLNGKIFKGRPLKIEFFI
ncbi:MAG: RNA-binding protein [Spirochaetaceae bacterium]|jgi:RNA recognition motif-containing protein|nr:RNA-binding protein [Spirochaetaceae bacterium]